MPSNWVVALVLMVWAGGARAQSGCTNVLIGMAPCLNYVTGRSPSPPSSCCSQLASVVQSQPQCLCAALGGGGSAFGININQTLALALPGACKVQTPPVSKCDAVNNGPATAPVSSPEGMPAETSTEAPGSAVSSPISGGSKAVPSNGATSHGSSIEMMPFQLVTLFLFMASYASISISF
ncbi:hypothetical protein Acr_24g0003930 [Actinidia rufa]|uniref:Bifunctional inhibitor/plant lipid transfer protein/seed storage helical domain-containing protein n=1 Tax=Actinidia rufa TaxID=165716 RepID=A0A7J0GTT2_9ERIC|nr:hypothetical protein Acr_24g0003930 [Actinidia rufa]